MGNLTGKVVAVTGASSGIGQAVAKMNGIGYYYSNGNAGKDRI